MAISQEKAARIRVEAFDIMANDKDEKDPRLPSRRPFIFDITQKDQTDDIIKAYEAVDKVYFFKRVDKKKRRYL